MLVQNLIQGEGTCSLDHHCQRESENQDVVFNSMAFFFSIPVHEEPELPVNCNERNNHDYSDAESGDAA